MNCRNDLGRTGGIIQSLIMVFRLLAILLAGGILLALVAVLDTTGIDISHLVNDR